MMKTNHSTPRARLSARAKRLAGRIAAAVTFISCVGADCHPKDGPSTICNGSVEPGCVDMLNFTASPANMFETGDQPSADNLVPPGNPGRGAATADFTDGATTSFTVMQDGATLGTVECTVGFYAWENMNPSVVLQQTGSITCNDWAY